MQKSHTTRFMQRVVFVIALAVLGGVLTSPHAWAQVHGSGATSLPASLVRDPVTQFLNAQGAWEDAYILPTNTFPVTAYAPALPGTRYVSAHPTGYPPVQSDTRYRTILWPCACPQGLVPALTSFQVHADNVATLFVNNASPAAGTQPFDEIAANFLNPPENLVSSPIALFPGPNILEVKVHNFGGPSALDYRATVACIKPPMNTPNCCADNVTGECVGSATQNQFCSSNQHLLQCNMC